MRRRFAITVLACVLATTAACGGGDGDDASTDAAPEAQSSQDGSDSSNQTDPSDAPVDQPSTNPEPSTDTALPDEGEVSQACLDDAAASTQADGEATFPDAEGTAFDGVDPFVDSEGNFVVLVNERPQGQFSALKFLYECSGDDATFLAVYGDGGPGDDNIEDDETFQLVVSVPGADDVPDTVPLY